MEENELFVTAHYLCPPTVVVLIMSLYFFFFSFRLTLLLNMLDKVHDDDDVWADSDGESSLIYERNLAEKEWERLQEDHGNVKFLKDI